MRFRAKFGAPGWCWSGSACLFAVLWLDGHRSAIATFCVVYFSLMTAQQVLSHFLIYWDFDSGYLRERRLWNRKEVAWSDVTHVRRWKPSSTYLAVDHSRLAPMSDRGRIVANPEDREGFIRALRKSAPQAEFEV